MFVFTNNFYMLILVYDQYQHNVIHVKEIVTCKNNTNYCYKRIKTFKSCKVVH